MATSTKSLRAQAEALTVEQVEQAIDAPFASWSAQCHAISIAIVKSDLFAYSRVARGSCLGVGGQHSWVVLDHDCYNPDAVIVDPTLWSYDKSVQGIWVGTMKDGRHEPHGNGSIWAWGRPMPFGEEPVELTPAKPLSRDAERFLDLIGPLDRRGWMTFLSHAPVGGWPAGEIIEAAENTKALSRFTPIDRVGMLTDLNPGGLYLKEEPRG
jgi:hypothetical protein